MRERHDAAPVIYGASPIWYFVVVCAYDNRLLRLSLFAQNKVVDPVQLFN